MKNNIAIKRKILTGLIATPLLVSGVSYLKDNLVSAQYTPAKLVIENKERKLHESPVVTDGRVFLPLREISKTFGAKVKWNKDEKVINIDKESIHIVLPLNEKTALINNKKVFLETPAFNKDTITLVPLQFLSQHLGLVTKWNNNTKTISISTKKIFYTVKNGDTLWSIALHFKTTVKKIKELNNLQNENLRIGQKLIIKGKKSPNFKTEENISKTHVVISGDTLWSISRKYDIKIEDIMKKNKLNSSSLHIGQKLILHKANDSNIIKKENKKKNTNYTIHTVKSGDSIWELSLLYKVGVNDILTVNNLNSLNTLHVGQEIKIPTQRFLAKKTANKIQTKSFSDWTNNKYMIPIGKTTTITDIITRKEFTFQRTPGTHYVNFEPFTKKDTERLKEISGDLTKINRAVLVHVGSEVIPGILRFTSHPVDYIPNNNFNGRFNIYFIKKN